MSPSSNHVKFNSKNKNWNLWNKAVHPTRRSAPLVTFNEQSRQEYLTGFHNRKLKRKELAKTVIHSIRKKEKLKKKKQNEQKIEDYYLAIQEEANTQTWQKVSPLETNDIEKKALNEKEINESSPLTWGETTFQDKDQNMLITTTIQDISFDSVQEKTQKIKPRGIIKSQPSQTDKPKKGKTQTSRNLLSSSIGGRKHSSRRPRGRRPT